MAGVVRCAWEFDHFSLAVSLQNLSSAGYIMCTNGLLNKTDGVFAPYN